MIGQLHWDGVVLPIPELTWDNVVATANRLEGLDVNDEFFVIYKDEEGEVINVNNAIDLVEATRWAVAQGVPCLCLQVPFASADSESDESWTEIDGSRRDLSVRDGDDVDESERRSVLHDEVDEEEIFFQSSKETPHREEIAKQALEEDLEVESSNATPETLPEESEPATPVDQTVETPAPEQESVIEPEEDVEAPVEEKEAEIEQETEELYVQPSVEEVEYETTDHAAEDEAEEEEPNVVVESATPPVVESPTAGLHERIIDIMVSVNEDSIQLSQSDSSFLLDFLSDERAVERFVAFISHPSVKSVINVVARAERASPGIAQKSATTQLIKVLYQSPEALTLLSAVPSFEEGLVRALKALRVTPAAKPLEEHTVEEEERASEPLVVHPNIACDGCDSDAELVGVRYKSAVRPDFDLCAACEASGRFQAEAGPFLKIVDPSTAPDFILCATAGSGHALSGLKGIESLEGTDAIANEFVEFVRSRRASAAAPPQVAEASPKRCEHQLKTFEAKNVNYVCDLCSAHQAQGSVLHGCRTCDFDVCQRCAAENSESISIAPQAPQAKFLSDVTLADGSAVRPGESLVKTWRVRNSGPETWPVGTRISHVGGDALGGPATGVAVPLAAPGEAVNITVQLTMPSIPGRYTSYWRMMTPHPTNAKFGHRFWVTVNVLPPNVSIAPVQMPFVPFLEPSAPPSAAVQQSFPPLFELQPFSIGSIPLPGSPAVSAQLATPRPPPPPPPPVVMLSNYDDTVARVLDFGFTDVEQVVRVVNEVNGDASAAIERLLEDSA